MQPNKVYQSYLESGTAWADAHCTASQLEDQLKSILAQITLEAKNLDDVNSMAEAKEIALASNLYRDSLKEAADARRDANRAKVKYEAIQALFAAQRTVEATERTANRIAT